MTTTTHPTPPRSDPAKTRPRDGSRARGAPLPVRRPPPRHADRPRRGRVPATGPRPRRHLRRSRRPRHLLHPHLPGRRVRLPGRRAHHAHVRFVATRGHPRARSRHARRRLGRSDRVRLRLGGRTTGPAAAPTSSATTPAPAAGGPTRLVGRPHTRPPARPILDEQAARPARSQLGDQFTVMGTPLRAVGFSTGGSSITNTTVFVELSEFARIHDDRVSYVLAGLDARRRPGNGHRPDRGRGRRQSTAQTREQFADSEARIVTDMSADLLRLMSPPSGWSSRSPSSPWA